MDYPQYFFERQLESQKQKNENIAYEMGLIEY